MLHRLHGILMALTEYMKFEKPIQANESIGGCFNSPEQVVWHQATLRAVPSPSSGHENALRVVDIDATAEDGFPKKLFAAHLIAMSDDVKSISERIKLLQRAVEIYPGPEEGANEPLHMSGHNPNNYFGWEALGTALVEAGRAQESLHAFEKAAVRWPVGAVTFAEGIREAIAAGRLPDPTESVVSKFWSEYSDPSA
jgi:hypothetical protein